MKGTSVKDTSRIREKESNVVLGYTSEHHSSLSHYIGKTVLEKLVPSLTGTLTVATKLAKYQMQLRDPGADLVVGDGSTTFLGEMQTLEGTISLQH